MRDGERLTVQGSTAVYELSRAGDVYACTCPSWRAQKVPPARRTCKHLRAHLGDAHEDARLGDARLAAAHARARRSGAGLPREPLELRARREAALAGALARFPAAAAHMRRVYGMPLPRHLAHAVGFWLGLTDDERDEAWAYLGCGIAGVAEWLAPGGLDRRPLLDERLEDRFRRDPPEFVTVFSGNSDGGHWGLWYDDPRELPRLVAHNWARDDAVTAPRAPTLLGALREQMIRGDLEPDEWPRAARILAWLDEVHALELAAHHDESIPPPPRRTADNIAGMDPVLPGAELPIDLVGYPAQQARYAAYRDDPARVAAMIADARRELEQGRPLRALFLGRELHWFDDDLHRHAAGALLVDAYLAADRRALADTLRVHLDNRDLPYVAIYAREEPPPLAEIAARGDLDALRAALAADPSAADLAAALAHAYDPGALALLAPRLPPAVLADSLDQRVADLVRLARYDQDTAPALASIRALLGLGAPAYAALARALATDQSLLALELAERVDPAHADDLGVTALHLAIQAGDVDVAARLLARGADPQARDARGETPHDRARDLWQRRREQGLAALQLLRAAAPAPAPTPPAGDGPRPGDRVVHPKFGEGAVEAREGAGDQTKLTIAFADGRRTLLARFVRPA